MSFRDPHPGNVQDPGALHVEFHARARQADFQHRRAAGERDARHGAASLGVPAGQKLLAGAVTTAVLTWVSLVAYSQLTAEPADTWDEVLVGDP